MWPNSQFAADLIIISEEILNGKLYFFVPCSSDLGEQLIWKYPQKMRWWNPVLVKLQTVQPEQAIFI